MKIRSNLLPLDDILCFVELFFFNVRRHLSGKELCFDLLIENCSSQTSYEKNVSETEKHYGNAEHAHLEIEISQDRSKKIKKKIAPISASFSSQAGTLIFM